MLEKGELRLQRDTREKPPENANPDRSTAHRAGVQHTSRLALETVEACLDDLLQRRGHRDCDAGGQTDLPGPFHQEIGRLQFADNFLDEERITRGTGDDRFGEAVVHRDLEHRLDELARDLALERLYRN